MAAVRVLPTLPGLWAAAPHPLQGALPQPDAGDMAKGKTDSEGDQYGNYGTSDTKNAKEKKQEEGKGWGTRRDRGLP